jgi:hypothetical protein
MYAFLSIEMRARRIFSGLIVAKRPAIKTEAAFYGSLVRKKERAKSIQVIHDFYRQVLTKPPSSVKLKNASSQK